MNSIPVLTAEDIHRRWSAEETTQETKRYLAFYSSILQGIVTDKELMNIPADDHLVHRGHGVFDTAGVRNGRVYQLGRHLDRFIRSAKGCRLWREDDEFLTKENLKRIILQTIRVAGEKDQNVRYYLGAGPGGFDISSRECARPSFYVTCITMPAINHEFRKNGIQVVTTSVPMKPQPFCSLKTTNYLPNALAIMEAQDKGGVTCVWTDHSGNVAETAIANLGFMIDGVFTVPRFDNILAGISIQRMMQLAERELNLKVEQRNINVDEGKSAQEIMTFGGVGVCQAVVEWDGKVIGTGRPGVYALQMMKLFEEDMRHGHGDEDQLIPIDELVN